MIVVCATLTVRNGWGHHMTHGAKYIPVYDARKAKIRGLWQRGSKYYARLKIAYPGEDHPKVRRVPLKGSTVS